MSVTGRCMAGSCRGILAALSSGGSVSACGGGYGYGGGFGRGGHYGVYGDAADYVGRVPYHRGYERTSGPAYGAFDGGCGEFDGGYGNPYAAAQGGFDESYGDTYLSAGRGGFKRGRGRDQGRGKRREQQKGRVAQEAADAGGITRRQRKEQWRRNAATAVTGSQSEERPVAPKERLSWATKPWNEWGKWVRRRPRHAPTTALDQAGQGATTAHPATDKECDVDGGRQVEVESDNEYFEALETMSPM